MAKKVMARSFQDMIEDAKKRQMEAQAYVKRTGKCCACKKRKAVECQDRCQKCIDESEVLLKKLRGQPGFMEVSV